MRLLGIRAVGCGDRQQRRRRRRNWKRGPAERAEWHHGNTERTSRAGHAGHAKRSSRRLEFDHNCTGRDDDARHNDHYSGNDYQHPRSEYKHSQRGAKYADGCA